MPNIRLHSYDQRKSNVRIGNVPGSKIRGTAKRYLLLDIVWNQFISRDDGWPGKPVFLISVPVLLGRSLFAIRSFPVRSRITIGKYLCGKYGGRWRYWNRSQDKSNGQKHLQYSKCKMTSCLQHLCTKSHQERWKKWQRVNLGGIGISSRTETITKHPNLQVVSPSKSELTHLPGHYKSYTFSLIHANLS